jgi:GNAT superfamily N-acetyltransferase
MVHELAAYELAPDECRLTEEQLHAALFAEHPALFGHVAEDDAGQPVGMTLWYLNYSSWSGVHGIFLEDLYVRPGVRGSGAGRALLAALARLCVQRGYARLDWVVLHWNPAREFYHAVGARAMDEWIPYRLAGEALHRLAEQAEPVADPGTAVGGGRVAGRPLASTS